MALKRYPELAHARPPAPTDLRPSEWRWLRVSEAAEALGISQSTVRRRIQRGRIVARREPYGHSFRWLVRFPCEVDDLRIVSRTSSPPASPQTTPPASPSTPRPVPSASSQLIASMVGEAQAEEEATPPEVEPAGETARASTPEPSAEHASGRAFWLAFLVAAVALAVLALDPPAASRGVALAVAALAMIMALGEGAVGLWQRGSGERQ